MNALLAVASADFRERTRTFNSVIVVAVLLELGYLFVPDRAAAYSTVDLGGWRGIYDSPWMGTSTAVLTVTILPLLSFFLIRPAQSRDAELRTYDLIAAAPVGRITVVLGKWASDVVLLAGFALILQIAAIVMQAVRAEDRAFDIAAYALPYLFITLPACAVTASAAMVVASIPGLRGIGGGIVWFFVWTAGIAVPMTLGNGHDVALDPLGVSVLTGALLEGFARAVPLAHIGNAMSIGVGAPATHVFRFPGIVWSTQPLVSRALWTAGGIAAVAAVSPIALATSARSSRARAGGVAKRIAEALPLPALVRFEFSAALERAGTPWLGGAVVLAVASLFAPADVLARFVAPLAWLWPIGPIAAASVVDIRADCDEIIRATSTPALQRALARTATCFLLACVPLGVPAIHAGIGGIAPIAIALAAAALAVAFASALRSEIVFEAIALLAWYLGPVNRLPALDPARAVAHPIFVTVVCIVVGLVATASTVTLTARRS